MSDRIAIVGSRDYPHLDQVRAYVAGLPEGTTIISGGARGVDSVAAEAAKARGLAVVVYLPDWKTHGRRAGLVRNHDIVAAADAVTAFWDGKSSGTAYTIRIAQKAGKPVGVFTAGRVMGKGEVTAE